MKKYGIGEIFEMDGVKMVCLPALGWKYEDTCAKCTFKTRSWKWCKNIACLARQRKDKKYVFFRQLNVIMKAEAERCPLFLDTDAAECERCPLIVICIDMKEEVCRDAR